MSMIEVYFAAVLTCFTPSGEPSPPIEGLCDFRIYSRTAYTSALACDLATIRIADQERFPPGSYHLTCVPWSVPLDTE